MALEGTLKDFGVTDIFQFIGGHKKTGVLTLSSKKDTVKILFDNGLIVHAESEASRTEDKLGQLLVRRGMITEEKLQEALAKQKDTLRRLGHILVKDGYLPREKMQEALYRQITQILYRLFRWGDGTYKFSQEETLDFDKENFVPISPESILMEGVQMMDEWPIIEKKIRDFDMVLAKTEMGEGKVQQKEDEGDEFEDSFDWDEAGDVEEEEEGEPAAEEGQDDTIYLAPHEFQIYQTVDGERSVREICDLSPLNEFGTCRALYDLLSRNLVYEVRRKKPGAEAETVAPAAKESHGFVAALGYMAVLALVLVSMGTFWMNPLGPVQWFLRAGGTVSEIGTDVSRLRLERIDYALQVYQLQYGELPETLDMLVERRFVSSKDLVDPWGARYSYHLPSEAEYTLTGFDSEGQVDPGLLIVRGAGATGSRDATAP